MRAFTLSCRSMLLGILLFITPQALADVILHAFDWHYNEVANRAEEIKNLGYKAVLVAPPLKSNAGNCAWWQRYQPQDIRVIDHCKGNKQSFQAMINALNDSNPARRVEVYADIVAKQKAAQPFVYPTGLIEIPMSPVSDIGAFRTGRWKLDWFLRSVRRCVEWAIDRGATFDFLGHPSCLYAVDPQYKTVELICDLVKKAGDRARIVDLSELAKRAE